MSCDHNAAQAAAMRILEAHLAARIEAHPRLCGCGDSFEAIMANASEDDASVAWQPRFVDKETMLDARFMVLQGETINTSNGRFTLEVKTAWNWIGPRYEFTKIYDEKGGEA